MRVCLRLPAVAVACAAGVAVLLGMASGAAAGEFAGGAASERVSVFHPLHDERRPLLAVLRTRRGTVRLSHLAPPGKVDAQVATNRRGDAVAAWTQGERLMAAFRARGSRRFSRAQSLGPRPREDDEYPDLELPQITLNDRGDAVVAWRTGVDTAFVSLAAWRPAGGNFAPARTLPVELWHVGLDDRGEALAVGTDLTGDRVLRSTSSRGAPWQRPRLLGRGAGEVFVVAASNGRGEAIVLWAFTDWRASGGGGAMERRNGVWRRSQAPPVRGSLLIGDAGDADVALSDSGDAALAYWDGGGLKAAVRPAGSPWQPPQRLALPDEEFDGLPYGNPRAAVGRDGGAAATAWTSRGIVAAYGPRGRALKVTKLSSDGRPESPYASFNQLEVDLAIGSRGATAAWHELRRGRIRLVSNAFGADGAGAPSVLTSVSFHRIGPRSACLPEGSITVVDNGAARVYTLDGEYYACMYSRGAPTVLSGVGRTASAPQQPALAGRFVAYVYYVDNAEDQVVGYVSVLDLRNDTQWSGSASFDAPVRSLVASPRGGVALIACGRTCRVSRRDVGAPRLVDIAESDSIEPESLRLDGEVLSWIDAGERRQSTLH